MIQAVQEPSEIMVLEDNSERRRPIDECLADRFAQYRVVMFATAGEFIDHYCRSSTPPLAIRLDHDLELIPITNRKCIDPGSGRDVADFLATQVPAAPVIIHSSNSIAVFGMTEVLREVGWQVHRVIPSSDVDWIYGDWFRTVRIGVYY